MRTPIAGTSGWKTFFDDQWPVRIAATSSATAALRERRLESGVGRWSEQNLTPYLFTEFLALVEQDRPVEVGDTLADSLDLLRQGQHADPDLAAWRRLFMLVGGFPELLTATRARPDEDESSRLLRSRHPRLRRRRLGRELGGGRAPAATAPLLGPVLGDLGPALRQVEHLAGLDPDHLGVGEVAIAAPAPGWDVGDDTVGVVDLLEAGPTTRPLHHGVGRSAAWVQAMRRPPSAGRTAPRGVTTP